ncbi:hypothetical protein QBC38DRAFT_144540 [Podospora fimiseda]|uniref:Uncharacterized protein n=1 Tax=Podospora fimiseda TaxID=252190 RepID=A0AAN7BZI5_9PEZI|nr:hypothetical protein QBC38DRAFT_144540 [Podospora fimiseda]
MSASRASIFSRPILRAAAAALVPAVRPTIPARISHHFGQPSQLRSYQKINLDKRRDPNADLIFTKDHVPSLEYYKEYVKNHDPDDITAEEMHRAVDIFCSVAKRGSSTWRARLEMDHSIDSYTLHHAAAPLMEDRSMKKYLEVGFEMMATASLLSYGPSTISLMQTFLLVELGTKRRKIVSAVEAQFKRLVQTEKNPDILTIQGLVARKEGRNDAALKFLNEAIELGNAGKPPPPSIESLFSIIASPVLDNTSFTNFYLRKPRWHYEIPCRHVQGLLLLKKKQVDPSAALKALHSFLINAVELDDPVAYMQLSALHEHNARLRRYFLLKAAQVGHKEGIRLLVKEYLIQLEEAEKSASPEALREAPEIQYIWGWILIAERKRIPGQTDDTISQDLKEIDQAVKEGRAQISLGEVTNFGTFTIRIWIDEGEESRGIELII